MTQYGVGDTITDLLFDLLGAVAVAIVGVARFDPVADVLRSAIGAK